MRSTRTSSRHVTHLDAHAPAPDQASVGMQPSSLPSRLVKVRLGHFDPLSVARSIQEDDRFHLVSGIQSAQVDVEILDESADQQEAHAAVASGAGVVVLARQPRPSFGMFLLAAGMSCISAGALSADVQTTVLLTARGGCMFVGQGDFRATRPDRTIDPMLTKRESEVLEKLAIGQSYRTVADALGISVPTVRAHAVRLRQKLRAQEKGELVGLPTFWLD